MTEQTDQQETSPMSDVLEFPGQRATSGATVAATAERLPDAEVGGAETEAEVIDFPGARAAEPESTETDAEAGTDVAVRPDATPVRRVGAVPPALAKGARATWTGTKAAGRGTAWAARASAPAVRFTARHSYYLGAGAWDQASSVYGRWTGRDIDRRIEAAQRDGEHGVAAELMKQRQESRKILVERMKVFGQFLKYSPVAVGGLCALVPTVVLIVSIAAAIRPNGMTFTEVWVAFSDAIVSGWEWMVWAATVPVPCLAVATVVGIVVKGYNARRRGGDAPRWVRPSSDGADAREVVPTEDSIIDALRHLGGIPKLNEAFKAGWGTSASPTKVWEEPIARDGQGYRARIRLPKGVDVETINTKKNLLAHNLVRFPVEVWPTTPKGRPGVMDLWIADQNILTEPVGTWPWMDGLEELVADFFAGVPVGKDMRGDTVNAQLFQKNYAIAGLMGSGKSSLAMNLVSGVALDPLVDIDVFVMAENTDFDPLTKRLSTLRTGTGEDVITDLCDHLQFLYDDLAKRGQALKENAAPGEPAPRKTSRALAEADDRLRPRVVVIDECQNLFMHKKHGEQAAGLVHQLVSTARKYGIVLILLTPEPSTESLPRKSMSVISNKTCFAIGDQRSNDAILGTGSYKRGEAATSLEPATEEDSGDVGTAMTKGFRKKPSLVRFYYINETEMARIGERAVDVANGSGGVRPTVHAAQESRDLLTDLDEVLDEQPMKAKDAAGALRKLAPRWEPYAKLDGTALARWLADEYGIHCPRPGNVRHVPSEEVRQELARSRAGEAESDSDDDQDGALEVDDDFTD